MSEKKELIEILKAILNDPEETKAIRCPACYEDGGCVMVSLNDLIRKLEGVKFYSPDQTMPVNTERG